MGKAVAAPDTPEENASPGVLQESGNVQRKQMRSPEPDAQEKVLRNALQPHFF
jgi:hypothetical protein